MTENDIIIENDDLMVVNGDIYIGNANNQNIAHILISQPGDYKLSPFVGVGIYDIQNQSITDFREIAAKIKDELKKDGYGEIKISGATNGTTGIQVSAKRQTRPK